VVPRSTLFVGVGGNSSFKRRGEEVIRTGAGVS